ncbi:MAG TPA: hypothetical protein V6D00_12135 [Pantanalinema sp.]
MTRRLLLCLLALPSLTACRQAPLTPSTPRPAPQATELGQLRVTVRWPEASAYAPQAIPEASVRAYLYVSTEGGQPLGTVTLARKEAGSLASASIELPPGEGYTLSAVLTEQGEQNIALGASAPFAIRRDRATSVSLLMEPVIATVAGTGTTTYDATASTALDTTLSVPSGLGIDAAGNLYVAVLSHNVIRKVTPEGRIGTVVGTGTATTTDLANLGDGAAAGAATLNRPQGVAVSPTGDLVIADTNNRRLRLVPASDGRRFGQEVLAGRIYTIATTSLTPNAVTLGPDGSAYFSEGSNPSNPPRVTHLDPDGRLSVAAGIQASLTNGDDRPGTSTALDTPDGIVVDARGNLMVADRGAHRVRMVCREAGTYFGIAMQAGRLYTIAGTGTPTTGDVSPLGDGGQGLDASLKSPRGLTLDAAGNLYIVDSANCRVRCLKTSGIITTIAGNAIAAAADKPALWTNPRLGDGGSALKALLNFPAGTAIGPGGALYISDTLNQRIRRLWL